MEPTDYQPIDCDLYSEYECAIVQNCRLQLVWRDDKGIVHLEVVTLWIPDLPSPYSQGL